MNLNSERLRQANSLGFSRSECVAFTGYRPAKLKASFPCGDAGVRIAGLLRPVILNLYENGARIFLSGMAEGFDLWAAAEVIAMHDQGLCHDACVAAIVPYKRQGASYDTEPRKLYDYILGRSMRVEILSQHYYPECYHRRNDFLVENVSSVVCFYDGQRGGTSYTVNRARRNGVQVINLYSPEMQFS